MASPAVSTSVRPKESAVYGRWARYYDRTFKPVYAARIVRCLKQLQIRSDTRVLEVGVGTGISLEGYPTDVHVTGIDASADMLQLAKQKIDQRQWDHIELQQMDAQRLNFPDGSFDYVMAFHVVSVVDDASRAMREMVRVCKPQGTIVIINHFRSGGAVTAKLMALLTPLTSHLGWRTDLAWTDLIRDLPVKVARCYKSSPASLFTVLQLSRLADSESQLVSV